MKASRKGSTGATPPNNFRPAQSGGTVRRYPVAEFRNTDMPWGAQLRALLPLRVAAAASAIFWLGLIAFVAVEFAFDGQGAPARWWLQPLGDALIFTVWIAACVATAACIWAMGAEWHRGRKSIEPMRKPGVASPGEGGRCSAL